jgi:hypothetical protein
LRHWPDDAYHWVAAWFAEHMGDWPWFMVMEIALWDLSLLCLALAAIIWARGRDN